MLDLFILKVKLFGFYFASLDIRQDSRRHECRLGNYLNELEKQRKSIGWAAFKTLTEEDQIKHLLGLTVNPVFLSLNDPFAEKFANNISNSFHSKSNGAAGCERYVISNCQSSVHMIEVFVLNRLLIGTTGAYTRHRSALRNDRRLAQAPVIMEELYRIPEYREHVSQRGNLQSIMLGFSDGTKDGGYLRANWSIFRQRKTSRQFRASTAFLPSF